MLLKFWLNLYPSVADQGLDRCLRNEIGTNTRMEQLEDTISERLGFGWWWEPRNRLDSVTASTKLKVWRDYRDHASSGHQLILPHQFHWPSRPLYVSLVKQYPLYTWKENQAEGLSTYRMIPDQGKWSVPRRMIMVSPSPPVLDSVSGQVSGEMLLESPYSLRMVAPHIGACRGRYTRYHHWVCLIYP